MELKKTTMLSAMVAVAGFLAEIIFHEAMSQSIIGVVLSVVLAVVILIAVYFVFDGIQCIAQAQREEKAAADAEMEKMQNDLKQKLYSIINELLQFQKAVYKEVCNLQAGSSLNTIQETMDHVPGSISALRDELSTVPEGVNALRQEMSVVPENVNALREELSTVPEHVTALREELSAVPEGVNALRQELSSVPEGVFAMQEDLNEMIEAIKELREELSVMASNAGKEDDGITEETIAKLEESISDNAMKSAKIVAKYIMKSNDEMREFMDSRYVKKGGLR